MQYKCPSCGKLVTLKFNTEIIRKTTGKYPTVMFLIVCCSECNTILYIKDITPQ